MGKITHINHACFLIETDEGKNIYIDPYKISKEFAKKPANGILATHNHHDHLDNSSIKIILTDSTELLIPESCSSEVKKYNATPVKPNTTETICGYEVEVIHAYNPKKRFHPKSNNWVGYIIDVGTKIFHAGDTDYIPEYKDLEGKVDIALLPVGDNYTMGFEDAIKTVSTIKPKIVIPMHHWEKDLQDFKSKCEETNPNVKIAILLDKDLEF